MIYRLNVYNKTMIDSDRENIRQGKKPVKIFHSKLKINFDLNMIRCKIIVKVVTVVFISFKSYKISVLNASW